MAFGLGSAVAAVQVIVPNQMRGQVGALFLLVLNVIGLNIGPVLPGFLDDHLFRDPNKIGYSLSITIALSALFMLALLAATRRSYRERYLSFVGAPSKITVRD